MDLLLRRGAACLLVSFLCWVCPIASAAPLVINANTSDPAPRAALEAAIDEFAKAHPGVEVQLTVFDHEHFKSAIRLFLMFDPPDVVTWFAGNRMKFFVDRGLFEDVSDIWESEGLRRSMANSVELMSVDGRQYGVPYTYYQWGFYYRQDLFRQHGLEPPALWEDFLSVCGRLREAGLTPIAMGSEALWPAAGWFDYLNLRLNGLEFHRQLTGGRVPYTDPRVRRVFELWRALLDGGYFQEEHGARTWQKALGDVGEGRAAMVLMGNFAVPFLREAGVGDQVGFFPFPVIDPEIGRQEDAPTDTVHIPSHASNKADARRFLAFLARPDVQSRMNLILGQLPVNADASVPEDRFLAAGHELLVNADGLAQFYDRDTTPEMARIGMLGFQKFMEEPDRLDFILERLEMERRRIYEIRRPPDGS